MPRGRERILVYIHERDERGRTVVKAREAAPGPASAEEPTLPTENFSS